MVRLATKSVYLDSPADYLNLVRRFPLRPIASAAEHKLALKMVDELMIRSEQRTAGETDYLKALARFVADYEAQAIVPSLGEATPRQVLRHLLEARDMTAADLGDVLGSRSAATMILRGQREMSKTHIRAAADYFGVSPAVFL